MTTFEYLAVLFSVVVGLAVTQTLTGILRVVRHRRTIRFYWPTVVWTVVVFEWTVFFWWFGGVELAQLQEWTFSTLLQLLAYCSALFILLGLLHPDDFGPGFDMRAHFEENHSWFFGVFLGVGLLDAAETSYGLANDPSALATGQVIAFVAFVSVWIVGTAVALRVRDSRYLSVLGVLLIVLIFLAGNQTGTMGTSLVS